MRFIGVEVEQETSAPPPTKNPGSAPAPEMRQWLSENVRAVKKKTQMLNNLVFKNLFIG